MCVCVVKHELKSRYQSPFNKKTANPTESCNDVRVRRALEAPRQCSGLGRKACKSTEEFVGSLTVRRQQEKDNEGSKKPLPGKWRFCTLFQWFKRLDFKVWGFG